MSASSHSGQSPIAILSITQGQGSGAESVLFELLNGWPAAAEPLLVAAPRRAAILNCVNKPNIAWLELDAPRNTIAKNLLAVEKALGALRGCRIIHGWSSRTFEIAWWAGKRLNKPAICTLHDHPQAFFITPQRRRIMRWAGNRLESLICVSAAVQEACIAAGYHVPMRVIHNGLTHEAERQPHTAAAGPLRLGFLGMSAPFKGFRLIESWVRQTAQQGLEWHLYGNVHESLRAEAQKLCDEYGGRVFLEGRQPPSAIYPNIDVLIHASLEFDSFPTVLLEAARAGLPVVATDLGGSVEIVAHGQTGFLFSPDQPERGLGWIQLLAQSPELRSSMGTAARARFAAEFGVERMVAQYADAWQKIGCA